MELSTVDAGVEGSACSGGGNTLVLKPTEYTPLTALLFAQLAHESCLPKGVLNIVTRDRCFVGGASNDHENRLYGF